MKAEFTQINEGWNADPNAPHPSVTVHGQEIVLDFFLDFDRFPDFLEGEVGFLRFVNVRCYRLGGTNDEGWYFGQCRYSKRAPSWGEFYEVCGDGRLAESPSDWVALSGEGKRHFLFYFKDGTFECFADRCEIEHIANNALLRTGTKLRFMPAAEF